MVAMVVIIVLMMVDADSGYSDGGGVMVMAECMHRSFVRNNDEMSGKS